MDIDLKKLADHPVVKLSQRRAPFAESLASESDRGCAVLALCVLEDVAIEAIKHRIGVFVEMQNVLCPPGRWAVTANSLCLLGILSRHERGDLKKLVAIRNEFAHKALVNLSFDEPKIASRIDQLKIVSWYWKNPQPKSRRERFLLTLHLLHTSISNRAGNIEPLAPCSEFFVIPDEWKDRFD